MSLRSWPLMLLAASCLLAGCATSQTAATHGIGTSARGQHVSNVARDIAGWHNAHHPDCQFVRPVRAQIIRDEGDAVVEHWTIEACDSKEFTYRAYLLPSRGALTVMVSDVRDDDYQEAP